MFQSVHLLRLREFIFSLGPGDVKKCGNTAEPKAQLSRPILQTVILSGRVSGGRFLKAALLDTRFAATGNLAEWVAKDSSELAFGRSPWERICGGNAGAARPDGATAPMSRKGDAPLSNRYGDRWSYCCATAHC